MQVVGGSHMPRLCRAYGKTCTSCRKISHFQKVCMSKRNHTVHKVEIEVAPEPSEEEIETVSINSIYLNRNRSLITAHLKTQVGKTTTEIPNKTDTGSEGNIMPLHIFKKLFKNMPVEQLKGSIKSNIKLKTYNGTYITQLGTCAVTIEFKNSKKHCVFFVVLGNGQALLGMPDTAALNILNLNIDSIQAQVANCRTNREQETHKVAEDCTNTNTAGIIKQKSNGQNQSTKLTNYFYSSKDLEADKRWSDNMTQKIYNTYGNVFNGIGCFKGTFCYSLNLTASHTKHHQGTWHMHYRSLSKKNQSSYKNWTS